MSTLATTTRRSTVSSSIALRALRWIPPLRWLVADVAVRRGRRALVGIALEAARLPDVSGPLDRRLRRTKTAKRLRRRARRLVSKTIRRL